MRSGFQGHALLGITGINIYPDLRFGFLWGGGTVPEARGRGAYSAVVARRMDHAKQIGLDLAGVYARIDTSSPIVARQGLERFGSMTYWVCALIA